MWVDEYIYPPLNGSLSSFSRFSLILWPSVGAKTVFCPRLPAASGRPLGEALEAGEAKIQALWRTTSGVFFLGVVEARNKLS